MLFAYSGSWHDGAQNERKNINHIHCNSNMMVLPLSAGEIASLEFELDCYLLCKPSIFHL